MDKMKVKFNTIDEFLEFLPENELVIVNLLRKLVFDCLPNCTEQISYNVPYYKIRKGICFIWPASVLWGSKKTYYGVRFGFNQGYQMKNELNYLDKGNRKQVYWRDIKSVKEIDVDILKMYLFEALEIDRLSKKN